MADARLKEERRGKGKAEGPWGGVESLKRLKKKTAPKSENKRRGTIENARGQKLDERGVRLATFFCKGSSSTKRLGKKMMTLNFFGRQGKRKHCSKGGRGGKVQ